MKILGMLFFLNIDCAFAAGGAEGSVFDLKWPFLNFIILATAIIWKVKKPLAEMFGKNFSDLEYLYDAAEKKDKESSMKYEMYKKKIEGVDKEYDDVLEKFRKKGNNFVKEYKKEGDIFIEKLQKDKDEKIEVEKKKMLREMENILMTNIISKAKQKIKEEQKLKDQVTKGLLSKIS